MNRSALGLSFILGVACTGAADEGKAGDDTAGQNNIDDSGNIDQDGDGYTAADGDCDDNDAGINPLGTEVCDGKDNNCDGTVDEGVSTVYFADGDLDGFGDDASALSYCEPPSADHVLVGGDCKDADSAYHPGADEPCAENVDYNCDGVVEYADDDGDGWARCEDCDDLNPDVSPAGTEICNGLDDDCDGEADPTSSFDVLPFYEDADADGYGNKDSVTDACAAPTGYTDDTTDCDDTRADVHPGLTEICDDLNADEDCNGNADDADPGVDVSTFGAFFTDADFDTYGDDASVVKQCDSPPGVVAVGGDCRDTDANFYPGAPETDCADPNDYNCDGSVAYTDADGDAYAACIECDDSDAAVNPGAVEICNGIDDDCDGVTDPDTATDTATWYADNDSDGFGDPAVTFDSCTAPTGYVADSTDCDDAAPTTYPGADEYCNLIDDDCDGVIDPTTAIDALTWYADADADTYGDPAATTPACTQPVGFVADLTDCDDTSDDVFPGATEFCNGIDDDCDTVVDPATSFDSVTWYEDADADTYGDPASTALDCAAPTGFVGDGTDCDDTDVNVNPGADEVCDSADVDEDCDGLADDDDPSTDVTSMTDNYLDADGDGYGDPATLLSQCAVPAGYVTDGTDCNDARSGVHPGAAENCDAADVDEDCDGLADDDDPGVVTSTYDTFYVDADGDDYGTSVSLDACDLPTGYAPVSGDCDDADDTISPDETEVCDSVDNDCDGTIDTSGGTSLCFSGPREFDNCSGSGATGPTQAQCDTSYASTTLDGEVTVSAGIQAWEVPTDGDYIIEAWGAQAFAAEPSRTGGLGAYATGTFTLTAGDTLYIIVGQRAPTTSYYNGGGGGGSFVVNSSGSPLVAAGGGGGTRREVSQNGCDGRSTTYAGTASGAATTHSCAAKTSGLGTGGIVSSASWGSGGAGFNGNGTGEISTYPSWGGYGGYRYSAGMNGGLGHSACYRGDGGFGGGGSGNGCAGGGGGGGYSGGDGGRVAGGGGSYVDSSGSSTSSTSGVQTGMGAVTIDM